MIAQMDIGQLLQGGAAGIVVLVVVLFLRHLTEQRKGHESYMARRDTDWSDRLETITDKCYDSHERTQTMVVDSIKDFQSQTTREHEAIGRQLDSLKER